MQHVLTQPQSSIPAHHCHPCPTPCLVAGEVVRGAGGGVHHLQPLQVPVLAAIVPHTQLRQGAQPWQAEAELIGLRMSREARSAAGRADMLRWRP